MIDTLSKPIQIAIAACLLVAPFVLWRVILDFAARHNTREVWSLMRWISLTRWISWVVAATVVLVDFLHPLSAAMLCISMGLLCFSIGLSFSVRYLKQQLEPPSSTA